MEWTFKFLKERMDNGEFSVKKNDDYLGSKLSDKEGYKKGKATQIMEAG